MGCMPSRTCSTNSEAVAPNPSPTKYKIFTSKKIKNYLIIEAEYTGCTNYEGRKIMVFKDCNIMDIHYQGKLDPHFSDDETIISPLARFKPDDHGWLYAERFVNAIIGCRI